MHGFILVLERLDQVVLLLYLNHLILIRGGVKGLFGVVVLLMLYVFDIQFVLLLDPLHNIL
jgi:hypothetical protein